MKNLVLTAALALAAATPAVAQDKSVDAADANYSRDLVVTYDDLDLDKRSDQRKLKNRLDKAAKAACGYQEIRTGTRAKDSEARSCYREARASALATFDAVMESHGKGG